MKLTVTHPKFGLSFPKRKNLGIFSSLCIMVLFATWIAGCTPAAQTGASRATSPATAVASGAAPAAGELIQLEVGASPVPHTEVLKYIQENLTAKEHKLDLVAAAKVHIEPLGIYSKKIQSLDEVPGSLEDTTFSVINGNYAIEAGFTPSKDALVLESGENNRLPTCIALCG